MTVDAHVDLDAQVAAYVDGAEGIRAKTQEYAADFARQYAAAAAMIARMLGGIESMQRTLDDHAQQLNAEAARLHRGPVCAAPDLAAILDEALAGQNIRLPVEMRFATVTARGGEQRE